MSLKEGWLVKQGLRMKAWQRRWFVLDNTTLTNYSQPGSKNGSSILLSDVSEVSLAPEAKRPHAFKLVIPSVRVYFVGADTQSECAAWVDCINRAFAKPAPRPSVSLNSFEIWKVITKGQYSKVHLVRHKESGGFFAMKSMSKRALQESGRVAHAFTERNILCEWRHPFIASGHWSFQTEGRTFVVLEYVSGGELLTRIQEENRISDLRTRLCVAELIVVLGFLHGRKLIYRGLKAENVLIDGAGHVKLMDFGLVKMGLQSSRLCGALEYMAPEVLRREVYTKAVDWWALGVLMYEMLTGLPPFYSEYQDLMCRMILEDEVLFPEEMNPLAVDLIRKLLDKSAERRLGAGDGDAEDVEKHPYFADLDWDRVYNLGYEPEWIPPSVVDPAHSVEMEGLGPTIEEEAVDPATQRHFRGFSFAAQDWGSKLKDSLAAASLESPPP
jgi:serine/threonine protein kinase